MLHQSLEPQEARAALGAGPYRVFTCWAGGKNGAPWIDDSPLYETMAEAREIVDRRINVLRSGTLKAPPRIFWHKIVDAAGRALYLDGDGH